MVSYILANTELQPIVSDWTTLSKGSTGSRSFGSFIGYNFQWDDVVLGAELNYNRMSLGTGAQDTVGPIIIPGAPSPMAPPSNTRSQRHRVLRWQSTTS